VGTQTVAIAPPATALTWKIYFLYIPLTKSFRMKSLSLKMDDTVFNETEKITSKISKNRNRYINEAVQFYNLLQKRKIISRQLQKESRIVQEESMKVLAEFEKLRDED
jgi:predicted transcriptional regulator